MPIVTREEDVTRYFVQDEFNPGSSKQLLQVIKQRGLQPGFNNKTGSESTDAETLKRLARQDPFFQSILDYREVQKIDSTYVSPYMSKADEDARIHGKFLHVPSTMRLSSVDPNLQNVPDEDDEKALARRFRHCIVATPGCLLVSIDFAAIEAVLTGYFMQDPDYVRLATKGIHAYVLSHLLGKPADLSWDDDKLGRYLSQLKAAYKQTPEYEGCKRGVHLTNYGGTPPMMQRSNPDVFPTILAAKHIQDLYLGLCPKLAPWQTSVRDRAAKEHRLGGNDHPFHYTHYFYDVVTYDGRKKKLVPGADWNRVVAYYPQSTAAGVLFEKCLEITDPDSPHFVGDLYYGRTPLRALIHDEILGEVPVERLSTYLERVEPCMQAPIPQLGGLAFRVDIKIGRDWGSMKSLKDADKDLRKAVGL